MYKILFFSFLTSIILNNFPTDFPVEIELLKPVSSESILLRVETKNLSDKSIKVLKNRVQDFKRERIKALGNYIIEIEKWETDKYYLFEPSSDIGFSYPGNEYESYPKGNSIIDTLHIYGYSFTRENSSKRGFPSGKYRIRISFNTNEWSGAQINISDWLEFIIAGDTQTPPTSE